HGSEELFGEPALSALALELVEKVAHLPPADLVVQVDEQVRRAEVSVELRDLVLQDHVVPERVPGELRDQSVILVPILAVMGEDEVRRHPPLDLLEEALHRLPRVRQEAVPEVLDHDLLPLDVAQDGTGARQRFRPSPRVRREDDPRDGGRVTVLEKLEDRPTAADLDVVTVRTEAEHMPHAVAARERDHSAPPRRQTSHGRSSRAVISSKACLSLKVSMQCQKPSWRYAASWPWAIKRRNGSSTRSSPSRMCSNTARLKAKNPPLIRRPLEPTCTTSRTSPASSRSTTWNVWCGRTHANAAILSWLAK